MIARKGILKDALNCEFDSFAAECMETNKLYHKHKCTNTMIRAGKQWVMDECRKHGLNQVDLFHSKVREDYWVQKRGLEINPDFLTDKDKLRIYIDAALPYATSMEHLAKVLYEKYEVMTRITNQTISFKLDAIIQRHVEEEKAKRQAAQKKQEKELFDSMQALMKTVDQYVKREDDYYNGLWDKYNAQNVNREIRTRGC